LRVPHAHSGDVPTSTESRIGVCVELVAVADAALVPPALIAFTRKLYDVADVRPVTVAAAVAEVGPVSHVLSVAILYSTW